MKSFQFLLFIMGCCAERGILPEGPVEALLRKNVTFKTLVDLKDNFTTFVWSFNRGSVIVPIIILKPTGETVAESCRGRVLVDQTNGFLTLGPVEAKDRGYYYATMVSSEEKKTGETMLRVLGCCEWYALPEGPVDAVSGKNVTFKTLIDPKEEFNGIVWFFINGSDVIRVVTVSKEREIIVSEAYQGRVTVNHTNGFLTLGPLAAKDNGDYHVNIFTTKGVKTGDTKLRVLEPVSNVTIRANLYETGEFNSTVVLTCSAKGSFIKFSWTDGNTPIVADDTRVAIKEEGSSSTLTICGFEASDLAGPIYCTAGNHLEVEKSTPFNLTVILPPTKPSFKSASMAATELPAKDKEGGELWTSSHATTTLHVMTSSDMTMSQYTTTSSHTTTSPYTTTSSHTTTSPYTTMSAQTTTQQRDSDTKLDNQDLLDIHRAWFDKLQAELVKMRLSFERSLRQMESRTHSLLWSMSRRLERMTEAMQRNSAPSHHKTVLFLNPSLPSAAPAVTPSNQRPGSQPSSHNKGQRTRGGRRANHS